MIVGLNSYYYNSCYVFFLNNYHYRKYKPCDNPDKVKKCSFILLVALALTGFASVRSVHHCCHTHNRKEKEKKLFLFPEKFLFQVWKQFEFWCEGWIFYEIYIFFDIFYARHLSCLFHTNNQLFHIDHCIIC